MNTSWRLVILCKPRTNMNACFVLSGISLTFSWWPLEERIARQQLWATFSIPSSTQVFYYNNRKVESNRLLLMAAKRQQNWICMKCTHHNGNLLDLHKTFASGRAYPSVFKLVVARNKLTWFYRASVLHDSIWRRQFCCFRQWCVNLTTATNRAENIRTKNANDFRKAHKDAALFLKKMCLSLLPLWRITDRFNWDLMSTN